MTFRMTFRNMTATKKDSEWLKSEYQHWAWRYSVKWPSFCMMAYTLLYDILFNYIPNDGALHKAFSIMVFSIMVFCITAFCIFTLWKTTFSIMVFSIMAFSIMAFWKMAFCTMTCRITTITITILSIIKPQSAYYSANHNIHHNHNITQHYNNQYKNSAYQ